MDSFQETTKHIFKVQEFLGRCITLLCGRLLHHDKSKLESPEKEVFDTYTDKLRGMTYNSPEYRDCLALMAPALNHHYQVNRHHSEHFKNGIRDMNLIDLMEMLCDWKAASLRHADGNIRKSIEVNQQRFGYSDELKAILMNTVEVLEFE